jgi:AcrR family transcriptional regulator
MGRSSCGEEVVLMATTTRARRAGSLASGSASADLCTGAERMSPSRNGAGPARSRPAGNEIDRSRVGQMQRARLVAAAGQLACEWGAGNVTVSQIVERAGVSRRTFYEVVADSEDCVLAALHDALQRAQARVLPAWHADGSWRERLRGALIELLELFDEDPVLAQLLVVQSLGMGHRVLDRRSRVIEALVDALQEGQAQAATGPERLSAEGAVGGVLAVLHARIGRPGQESLTALAGRLMGMLVLPYEGPAAARREIARPAPITSALRERDNRVPLLSDPFKDAGLRLTYRTMRVLSAIAEHPGCSNREVGGLAEMSDQGQISKLLARLERIGVIANGVHDKSRGLPNAWTLTDVGSQVTHNIRMHTEPSSA